YIFLYFIMLPRPPPSTLFPYTTLFRSGPWALLARKNLFEACREGIVLGNNPGETSLVIEKNNFVNTRGANLRAMPPAGASGKTEDRKSTRLNSSHRTISYAVFCLKKKK